jgi:hypothetical protein
MSYHRTGKESTTDRESACYAAKVKRSGVEQSHGGREDPILTSGKVNGRKIFYCDPHAYEICKCIGAIGGMYDAPQTTDAGGYRVDVCKEDHISVAAPADARGCTIHCYTTEEMMENQKPGYSVTVCDNGTKLRTNTGCVLCYGKEKKLTSFNDTAICIDVSCGSVISQHPEASVQEAEINNGGNRQCDLFGRACAFHLQAALHQYAPYLRIGRCIYRSVSIPLDMYCL